MNFLSKSIEFPQQINLNYQTIWRDKCRSPHSVVDLWSMETLSDHHKTLSHNILHRTVVEWSKNTQLRVCAYTRVRTREARTPHLPYFSCHPDVPLPNTTPSNSPKRKSEQHLPLGLLLSIDLKLLTRQTSDLRLQTSDFRPLLTRILVHGTFPFLPVVCGKTTFIYQCIVGCLIFYFECARFIWVDSFIW